MNKVLSRKADSMLGWEAMTADGGNDVFVLPATPNQTRFWSLDQLLPGNPALNMPLAWSCHGNLNAEYVAEALSELVSRHESLRTTFDVVDGVLSQIVQPPFRMSVPFEDLTHLSLEARKERAEAMTRQESRLRMDMKRGPLFFARLIRMDIQDHILLITMHHSICDGWSNGIVLRDFAEIYDGLSRKSKPDLPKLDIQFGDFAVWLEQWRKGSEPAESLQYWRTTLGRDFTPLRIKHDSSTDKTDALGDIETLLLSPELGQQARDFCAAHGITPYMLLLATYGVTLFHLTGRTDILIGTPCANRRPGTENLIGPFSNPQVIRSKMEPTESFRSILDRVQSWTLGAIAHQDLPFEDLIEDDFFSGERNQIRLEIYFVYQRAFMQTQRTSELEIVPIRSVSPGATFELMLSIVERTEGQRLQLEFNPDFFHISTIRRILRLFKRVLEAGISNAAGAVGDMEILDESERRQILEEWNRTDTDFGRFEPVHKLISRCAAQMPTRKAVVCNGTGWTYEQLNEYSNQVARYLQQHNVGEGKLVAVCLDRSREMLGVVLGVLKSGAAYLPLDPTNPSERINLVLADAKVAVLITREEAAERLKSDSLVMCLETEEKLWKAENPANLDIESGSDSLAYVIYTSGSTGKPKGVAVEHGALTNLLRSMEREPGLDAKDTLVSVTTLSFDISALELFLPLMVGARLVIATTEQVRDGYQLLDLIQESGATVMQSTPGVWRVLIEAGWRGKPHLKVLCGGEAMPIDLAKTLREYSGEVWNLYGPTETTIWSSATRVDSGPVSIGPPIANTQFYVLDERMRPVPVGVTGELFIGGKGLARGYWHRPELTEEKFLPNPFGAGRIYRTGDLARWYPNGNIDLLGRTDFQVKVRGYRIELGEIETELTAHPAVRDAVVIAIDDELGNKRLAAYVDSKMDPVPEDLSGQLLSRLASHLPDYMVPAIITVLPALPRTPNGKIDRKNLPVADFATHLRHQFVKPRNDVERQLVQIWRTVLGLDSISVEANFFELGGNSLMILRLIARVNTAFQSLLPIPIIYTAPTIAKMAGVLSRTEEKDFVLALQPNGMRPPLFMIQSYHLYRTLPAALGGDQPFYGVRELEMEDRTFPYTLEDLVRSYVRHIREVQPHGPYYLGGFCFFALLAYAVAAELENQGYEVAFLGLIDANCPHYWRSQTSEEDPWKRYRTVLSYHLGQLGKLSFASKIGYAARFVSRKVWNQMLRLSLWVRHRAYGYYLSRKKPLPVPLRNKTMVTRVSVRLHKPKPIRSDIYLFPAADQPYPDNFDTALGWGEMTKGRVKTVWLPGNHDDMFLESNIDVMAQELRRAMNEVMQPRAESPYEAAK